MRYIVLYVYGKYLVNIIYIIVCYYLWNKFFLMCDFVNLVLLLVNRKFLI